MTDDHDDAPCHAPPGPAKRGPRTPEGKARSAQNARRHGLRAKGFALLPGEDEGEWRELLDRLRDVWEPEDDLERELVEAMAAALWRAGRADLMEAELLASMAPDGEEGFHGGDLTARAAHRAGLATVVRYQTAAQNAARRAQDMLLRHRKAKREGLVAADHTNEFARRTGKAAGAPGGDAAPAVALRRRLLGLLDRAAPKAPEDLDLAEAVCAELEPGWPRYAGPLRPRQVCEALAGLPPLDPGDRDWLASPELARACLRGAMAAAARAAAVTSAAAGDRPPAAA